MRKEVFRIKHKKAQAWSMDIIIGVVLFLVIIVAIYALVSSSSTKLKLREDANNIYGQLDNETSNRDLSFFQGNKITKEGAANLINKDYDTVKNDLGIDSDFCIVVTDKYGGIVSIAEIGETGTRSTFGNPDDGLDIGQICGS